MTQKEIKHLTHKLYENSLLMAQLCYDYEFDELLKEQSKNEILELKKDCDKITVILKKQKLDKKRKMRLDDYSDNIDQFLKEVEL